MKVFKRFSFWFTLFSVFICIFNYVGFDDMDIIIYLVSPPFWLLNTWISTSYPSSWVDSFIVIYTLTILFWLLLGMIIDTIISLKGSQNDAALKR